MMNSGSETTASDAERDRVVAQAPDSRRRHHAEEQRERDHQRVDDRRQDRTVFQSGLRISSQIGLLRPRRVAGGRVAEVTGRARRRASRRSARPRAGRAPSARASRRAARAAPCVRGRRSPRLREAARCRRRRGPRRRAASGARRGSGAARGERSSCGEGAAATATDVVIAERRRSACRRARQAAPACPSRLQPDVPVVPAAQVEERAGRDPAHVRRGGVDDVLVVHTM